MNKKILYIDMDNVIVDFKTGIQKLDTETQEKYKEHYDKVPGIFAKMDPMPEAIESVKFLTNHYVTYILSTAPWDNPSAWSDKIEWIQKYFGKDKDSPLYKRLILSHHKNLNQGDYLIDDRIANGAGDFGGELIQFWNDKFPDWNTIITYLKNKDNL